VAEDFAVEQGFRQAAAVDGDEIAVPARAGFVQAACDEFLAAAGFAVDEHVGGAVGEAGEHLAQLLHARRAADQLAFELVALGELAAQVAHFEDEAALFQGAADDFDEEFRREGFLDEIVGAVLHRLNGHRHVAVAGDQDDGQFRVKGEQFAQEGHAVHFRQAHVADHDAAEVGPQLPARLFGRAGAFGGDAFELQRLFATQRDVGVVFNDQYLERFSHQRSTRQKGAFPA